MKIENIITDLKYLQVTLRNKVEQVEYWKNEAKRLELLCKNNNINTIKAPKKKTGNNN